MITKKTIFLFFFLFLISVSIASADTLLDEHFDYYDAFAAHGWTYTTGCSYANNTPINWTDDITGNLFWGENRTIAYPDTPGCNFGSSSNLKKTLGNYSSRTVTLSFDFYYNTSGTLPTSASGNIIFQAALRSNYMAANEINVRLRAPTESAINYSEVVLGTSVTGGMNCEVGDVNILGNHSYELSVDTQSGKYHFKVDGVYKCVNVSSGNVGSPPLNTVYMDLYHPDRDYYPIRWGADNIFMTNSSEGLAPFGGNGTFVPCTKNEDCASGLCEFGQCALLGYHQECTSDTQCLSGQCINGFCTNPPLASQIKMAFNMYFGIDESSQNIISIIFLIAIVCISLFLTRHVEHKFIITMCLMFLVMLVETIIGILSAWVFFMFVIFIIAIAMVMMYIKSREG